MSYQVAKMYFVNSITEMCTFGQQGTFCKHQALVHKNAPLLTREGRHELCRLALFRFFEGLHEKSSEPEGASSIGQLLQSILTANSLWGPWLGQAAGLQAARKYTRTRFVSPPLFFSKAASVRQLLCHTSASRYLVYCSTGIFQRNCAEPLYHKLLCNEILKIIK